MRHPEYLMVLTKFCLRYTLGVCRMSEEKESKSIDDVLRDIRFEDGRVLVSDERFILGHKYLLEFAHTTFEDIMGPAAKAVLYKYGETFGFYITKGSCEKWGLEDEELIDFLGKALTVWGFGKVTNIMLDKRRKFLKANMENSIELIADVKTEKPMCHFLAGFFGGVGKYLFSEDVICREKMCASTGDPLCVFEVEPYFR